MTINSQVTFHFHRVDRAFNSLSMQFFSQITTTDLSRFQKLALRTHIQQLLCPGPLIGVFGEALPDKVVEGLAPPRRPVEMGRVGLLDLQEDAHRGHVVVRGLHLRELDQGDAQGPDVNLEKNYDR